MRKIIMILIISIIGLEVTSCASVGSQAVKEVGRTAGRQAVKGAGRTAGHQAIKGAGRTANHKVVQEAEIIKKKIYDTAYKEALNYYELQANQASQDIANQIAVKAASDKNRELGGMVGDATVTAIAGFASTAAATNYQAKNQG